MRDLRRSMRQTALKGAQAWAKVESVALSAATVRLATNGARLTNLQMLAPVYVGQRVIVDFVSEDKPTVRPYTTAVEETIEDEIIPVAPKVESYTDAGDGTKPELDTRIIAGQATRSTPVSNTFWKAPHPSYTESTYVFPFNYVNYNWGNSYDTADEGGLIIRNPGRYLLSMRIGFDWVDDYEYSSTRLGLWVQNSYGRSFSSYQGVQIEKWHDIATDVLVLYWTGFLTFTAGSVARPLIKLQGNDWFSSNKWIYQGLPVSFPVSQQRYPIFQWWRMCPMIGPQSFPEWYYHQS